MYLPSMQFVQILLKLVIVVTNRNKNYNKLQCDIKRDFTL